VAKIYSLDKIVSTNTTYTMEEDRYFVIRQLGVGTTSDVTAKVDGVPCGTFISTVAPLHKTSSNLLGPIDLGRHFIVVPPERKLLLESTASADVRIKGDLVVLSPGESMLGEHADRYAVQGKKYLTYVSGSYSLGTDVAWADGVEYTVYSLTPATIEEYTFDDFVGVTIENLSAALSEGDVGIRFYLDGVPLDQLTSSPGQFGALSMPAPPADTTEEVPFTLERFPISVLGDHTFEIKARNTSGGSLSPTAGTSITITVYAIAEYLKKT
jgi:hypothetical protein